MMKTFVEMVAEKLSPETSRNGSAGSKNRSDALQSVESHLIALAAEKSRLSNGALVQMADFYTSQESL